MSFRKRKLGSQLKIKKDSSIKLSEENENKNAFENTEDENTPVSIHEIKLIQKVRKRQQGLNPETLVNLASAATSLENTPEASEKTTDQNRGDLEKGSTLLSLDTFTQQTNALDTNKNMMLYIEEKMSAFKQDINVVDTEEQSTSKENSSTKTEMELIKEIEDKYISNKYIKDAERKAEVEGSIVLSTSMLTSIPEVDLGIRTRLENIENTERAKKELHSKGPKTKALKLEHNNVRYILSKDMTSNRKHASDSIVVQKFKKRFNR
ncbi:hypothetical protein BB560_002863 [Smittium megazygosporum]|uniref:Uncharacterized protein n=1 Tax=Smittium megazygosporum TaxID=133381 RepID=A0A2T9ZDR0_9FUNG|nr:hypothetical protein BB560_002863 [Smittium megazygosporum]